MKKLSPSLLYVPLVFLIVFNVGFVLYSLVGREEAFFWRYRMIFQREWLGLPFYFLIFIIVLIGLKDLLLQKKTARFLRNSFVVVILFFCAYQISLFPTLNRLPDDRVPSMFLRKHDSSLEEAAEKSFDWLGKYILNYLKMDHLLRGKTLIVPKSGIIPYDLYFNAFVHPDIILPQPYEFRLTSQQMEVIKTFKYIDFPSPFPNMGIISYRVNESFNGSEIYVAFSYGDRIYLIPKSRSMGKRLNQ